MKWDSLKAENSSCVCTAGTLQRLSVLKFRVQIVFQLRVKRKIPSFSPLHILQDTIEQLSSLWGINPHTETSGIGKYLRQETLLKESIRDFHSGTSHPLFFPFYCSQLFVK